LRVSSANQRSTRFSHDELVGVKWNVKRGWASSHFSVAAVDHPYERSIEAGSDHLAVVVDLELRY